MVESLPAYVETAVYLYILLVAAVGVALHAWLLTHRTDRRAAGETCRGSNS